MIDMEREVPYGYCHCGCGQRTPIAQQTRRAEGIKKGQPRRFIRYHTKRKPLLPIECEAGVCRVPLHRRDPHEPIYAEIDASDRSKIEGYRWYPIFAKTGVVYAQAEVRIGVNQYKWIPMHRLIANTPDGMETDHIDGDGLNNRRSNLRACTRAQNNRNQRIRKDNSTGYRGVRKVTNSPNWYAQVRVDNRDIYLGTFTTPEAAAQAYNEAAKRHHGEFANLNNVEVPNEH